MRKKMFTLNIWWHDDIKGKFKQTNVMIYSSITVIYLFGYLADGYLHRGNTHPSVSWCDWRVLLAALWRRARWDICWLMEKLVGFSLCGGPTAHREDWVSRVSSITLSSSLMTQHARLPTCASWCAATGRMRMDATRLGAPPTVHTVRRRDRAPRSDDSAALQGWSGERFCWVISRGCFLSHRSLQRWVECAARALGY